MLLKNRLILCICISLTHDAYATMPSRPSQICIMLGSAPSLIIKLKDISSKKKSLLDSGYIRRLSSNLAQFTTSRAMSDGAYIVYFTPSQMMRSAQIKPGCYSQSIIDSLVKNVKAKANIEYLDPNSLLSVSTVSSRMQVPVIDPIQWDMLSPPGGIDTQTAFNTSMGNPKTITAVLDVGVLNNDSLNPNVLSGVTFNNNGTFNVGATPSCDSSCEGYDHGTHVSGTIAASGILAYGQNIYGVAPNSKVLPINVFTKFTDQNDCGLNPAPCILSFTSDQVNALNWLTGESFPGLPNAQYVAMVNMSLGGFGPCATSQQLAFNKIISSNISIAVAAGNANIDASSGPPANCLGVMPVAATDRLGYGTFYSNYGNIVSFAAPGGDETVSSVNGVYSTVENAYAYMQGTSMASPHAAGLGALLYSIDPTLTSAGVLSIMQSTATPFPLGGPGNSCTPSLPCGAGILNANSAVLTAVAQAPVLDWTPNVTSVINSITQATISWQSAGWSPSRLTTISYTVNVNGQDVGVCTQIPSVSCVLNHLTPDAVYTVMVRATDYRQIYGPLQSQPYTFSMPSVVITPPVLTLAARNPLLLTTAYVYYSKLGGPTPNSYVVNGVPNGVVITLDASNNRFILDNIITPKQIDNVTISALYGSLVTQSNSIVIPSIL